MTATTIHAPAPRPPRVPARAGPFRWTRAAYEQAVAAGVFEPQGEALVGARVELLDGEIVTMPPQGPLHVTTVAAAGDVLREGLRRAGLTEYLVRVQAPLAVDDWSEPEPDLAIVRGRLWDYADAHPSEALLIIEVADATRRRDQTRKARLYARNAVPEYWLLDLRGRVLEVMREPAGDGYRQRAVHGPAERVASTALPGLLVAVGDLLR